VEDHTLVSFFLESGEWIAHSHLCLLSVSVVELDSGQTHVLSLHAALLYIMVQAPDNKKTIVSDIAVFVLKRDVKLQLTN